MRKCKLHTFPVILIALLFNSCQDGQSENIISAEYVPGQIAVGFVDTVTYCFAVDFIESVNLEILQIDFGHAIWAWADSNDLAYYQDLFSTDTTVKDVDKLASSPIDTLQVVIIFNGVNSLHHDSLMVQSSGLHIYRILLHPKFTLLGVSIGHELKWINILNQYAFIRYAEPNYITTIGLPD